MPEVQKRKMSVFDKDAEVVTFPDLFEMIRGSTNFTIDNLLLQISKCQDVGEDFRIDHGGHPFRVPVSEINEFFKTNEKPKAAMTAEQENAILKKRLEEMEARVMKLTGEEPEKKQRFTGITRGDEFKTRTIPLVRRKPVAPEPVVAPPDREADKMTPSELTAQIKKDLAGTKGPKKAREMPVGKAGDSSPKAPTAL